MSDSFLYLEQFHMVRKQEVNGLDSLRKSSEAIQFSISFSLKSLFYLVTSCNVINYVVFYLKMNTTQLT